MERKIFVVMENCEYEYEATVTNVLGAYSKFEDAVNAIKTQLLAGLTLALNQERRRT